MPSDFALNLGEHLCRFFSITATEKERSEFARAVDFHAKHLATTDRDDLASLLFLECGDEAEKLRTESKTAQPPSLQMADLRKLLSRVQKRLYRDAHNRMKSAGARIQSQPSRQRIDPVDVERVLSDFKDYVAHTLSSRDGVIFELRFVHGMAIDAICRHIGVEKSTIYDRIQAIKALFTNFVADLGHPSLHDS